MSRKYRGRSIAAATAVALVAAALPSAAAAAPSNNGCNNRNLNQIDKLLECVDAEDVFVHLDALQGIADANGGTRASGTPGYDESADYVADLLENAGFIVERQEFSFCSTPRIRARSPWPARRSRPQSMQYSGSRHRHRPATWSPSISTSVSATLRRPAARRVTSTQPTSSDRTTSRSSSEVPAHSDSKPSTPRPPAQKP